MNNIEKYIESFKTKHEAFMIGCDSIEEMNLWDKETLGEMEAYYSYDLISIIIRLITADGEISEKEVTYLNETFGFDYSVDELVDVYDSCKDDIGNSFDENFENGITYMRRINSKLADSYKELLALICEIIINSDGVINGSEVSEVKRLKALCE